MNKEDQAKVLRAGFTLLRRDKKTPTIKIKTAAKPYSWIQYKSFPEKAMCDSEMNYLLTNEKYLED